MQLVALIIVGLVLKCDGPLLFYCEGVEVLLSWLRFQICISELVSFLSYSRDGILEWHFYSRFLGINSSLLGLKFLSGFIPKFFQPTKCYP